MTVYGNYNMNNAQMIRFRGDSESGVQFIKKPIEKVENISNTIVDTFSTEEKDEETKKSNKTAIKVASAVGVLSLFVALLNPKYLGKLSDKLKIWSEKAGKKARTRGTITGNLYSWGEKALDKAVQLLQFSNNLNTVKDECFKWLCKKSKILKKPHDMITRWFDSISKHTVYWKYDKVNTKMDKLNRTLEQYKARLNPTERANFDAKLAFVREKQQYFSQTNVANRLKNQEKLMSNLENDTIQRMKDYWHGFSNNENKIKHIKDNLDFWAEKILMPKRLKIEKEGNDVVTALTGNGKNEKGAYKELIDIISPYLKEDEKKLVETAFQSTAKKLTKANKSECIEYFGKKRDLMLGSAPTDVITALGGLAISGIAVGTADDSRERISRALTMGFPVIAGLGVSMGMTALLYSGVQGMLIGTGSSLMLSKVGSYTDKHFNPKPIDYNKKEMA